MKTRYTLAALLLAASWTAGPSALYAVPLLAVDCARGEEDALQSGFQEMTGAVSQTTANVSFGAYTVDLAGQGFFNATNSNAAAIDASVRPLYRDYFYHNSDVPGVGVTLGIGGVTPHADYNLTLWPYDPDQTFSATPTTWGPTGSSSGTSGSCSLRGNCGGFGMLLPRRYTAEVSPTALGCWAHPDGDRCPGVPDAMPRIYCPPAAICRYYQESDCRASQSLRNT